jgi:hypothetical protein
MRPLTGARPAARDTSNSVGLRCSSRRRRARHTRSSGAQTHTEGGAPPQSLGVARPRENCYRWRTRVQAGTSGDAAPAGAAFRCRVVSALCVPARRLGAGRPRPLPRVVHHRLGVSLAVASLGGAGEQGQAPSFFARVDVDFPSRTTARARRSGGQQRPRRSRGQPSPERAYTRNEAMDIGEPAARTRSSRSRIRCRASYRTSRLSGKSRPSLRASPEKVPA